MIIRHIRKKFNNGNSIHINNNTENHPAQPKLILEILTILLERKDEEEEHFLSISTRADPDTRLGFLKFLKVLFHQCESC